MRRWGVSFLQTCLASRSIHVHASDTLLSQGGTSESSASYLREGSLVSQWSSLWKPTHLVRSAYRACWSKGVSVLEHAPSSQAILGEWSLTTLADTGPSESPLLFRPTLVRYGQITGHVDWLKVILLFLCLRRAGMPLTACRANARSHHVHSAQWSCISVVSSSLTGGIKVLERVVSESESSPVACGHFRCVHVDQMCTGWNAQERRQSPASLSLFVHTRFRYRWGNDLCTIQACHSEVLLHQGHSDSHHTVWWRPRKGRSNVEQAILLLTAACFRTPGLVPRTSSMEYPSMSGDESVPWLQTVLEGTWLDNWQIRWGAEHPPRLVALAFLWWPLLWQDQVSGPCSSGDVPWNFLRSHSASSCLG